MLEVPSTYCPSDVLAKCNDSFGGSKVISNSVFPLSLYTIPMVKYCKELLGKTQCSHDIKRIGTLNSLIRIA